MKKTKLTPKKVPLPIAAAILTDSDLARLWGSRTLTNEEVGILIKHYGDKIETLSLKNTINKEELHAIEQCSNRITFLAKTLR